MFGSLTMSYNRDTDVMELRSDFSCPSYGEEIDDGLYLIFRQEDNEPIGLTILDFVKTYQNRGFKLPFECRISAEAVKRMQHSHA